MKINWLKVVEFVVTYGPVVLQAFEQAHAVNQKKVQ